MENQNSSVFCSEKVNKVKQGKRKPYRSDSAEKLRAGQKPQR